MAQFRIGVACPPRLSGPQGGMDSETKRLEHLKAEYQAGVLFHREEYAAIEAKVKYWLTFLLTVSLALAGFGFDQGAELGSTLLAGMTATLITALFSIFTFAFALSVVPVDAGILRPSPPSLKAMRYYTRGENWHELIEAETDEALRAFAVNEEANRAKAQWLIRGQAQLFFGLPTAPLVGVAINTLLDASASELRLVLVRPLVGVGAGVLAGILTVTLVHFVYPLFRRRQNAPNTAPRLESEDEYLG